jgi:hypothetical protein
MSKYANEHINIRSRHILNSAMSACNAPSGGLKAPIYPVCMSPADATERTALDRAVGRR